MFDLGMIKNVYADMAKRIDIARDCAKSPLTLAEKILYTHLHHKFTDQIYKRGVSYVEFSPDRVAMQDATAQMALLQFMMAGKAEVAVPSSVHCDHLIQARKDASSDLSRAKEICDLSSGYIYYISVKGITGSNDLDSEDVKQKVELLSNQTDLPIAIGFGIKDSNSALSVKELADGIVAGSVFVDLIGEGGDTVAKISKKTKELSLAIK